MLILLLSYKFVTCNHAEVSWNSSSLLLSIPLQKLSPHMEKITATLIWSPKIVSADVLLFFYSICFFTERWQSFTKSLRLFWLGPWHSSGQILAPSHISAFDFLDTMLCEEVFGLFSHTMPPFHPKGFSKHWAQQCPLLHWQYDLYSDIVSDGCQV